MPGVYIFKDAAGTTLYVGKAVNLKNRVNSYFQSGADLGPKTTLLVSRIVSLEYILVNSEMEALLLESRLIRKFLPPYNIASRDDKTPYYIHLTREEFPKPLINHQPLNAVAGPFLNRYLPQKILRFCRRITPYCTAPRPVKKPCLYSHLGLCSPCPGQQLNHTQRKLYAEHITTLKRLLSGRFSAVTQKLHSQMLKASREQEYEQASVYRNQLLSLQSLSYKSLPAEDYLLNPNLADDLASASLEQLRLDLSPYLAYLPSVLNRIEMFDIAHLSGSSATGAMTVAVSGHINPGNFRHFHIRRASTTNDVDMLLEVVSRRLKRTDWPYPDLLVLDGGIPQLSIVSPIRKFSPRLPVIALSKNRETLVIPQKSGFFSLSLPINHPGLRLLIRLRDEAHRFSRRLHHHNRTRMLYN